MELSKTWQTAKDTLLILQRLQGTVEKMRPNSNPPPLRVQGVDFSLFKPFGPTFCTKLQIILENITDNPTFRVLNEGGSQGFETEMSTEVVRDSGIDGYASIQNDEGNFTVGDAQGFDFDSENLMSTLLEGIGGGSMFNGENWFLQDLC